MIIAVVVHYWPNRRKYISGIVSALAAGSFAPDRIVVWNNSGVPLEPVLRETIINCDRNLLPICRYAAALIVANNRGGKSLAPDSEPVYCVFQDDDLIVGKNAVEQLITKLVDSKCSIVGPIGCKMGEGARPYLSCTDVIEGKADIVVTRLMACRLDVVADVFAFMADHGIFDVVREDDLIAAFSVMAQGGRSVVVPVEYTSLEEGDQGFCRQAEHYELRNQACIKLRAMLP